MTHLFTSNRTTWGLALLTLALLWVPHPVPRVLAMVLAAVAIWGIVLTPQRLPFDLRLATAIVGGPMCLAVFAALGFAVGVASVFISVILPTVAILILTRQSASENTLPDSTPDRPLPWTALLALLVVGATLALYLPATESWWRYREDSWFHAAVIEKIIRSGVPPTDPYFSGLSLRYMYMYHAILGLTVQHSGCSPFAAMMAFNVVAIAGLVAGSYSLASVFTNSRRAQLLATALATFGLNGGFFLYYPIRVARSLVGESTGVAQLSQFFATTPPSHDTAWNLVSIAGNQALLIDKFMLGTAISLTFGAICVVVRLIAEPTERRTTAPLLAVLSAGIMLWHVVIGAVVFAATAVALAVMATRDRRRGLSGLAGIAVAALLVTPYVFSVLRGGEGTSSIRFDLQANQLVGLAAAITPVGLFSLWGWRAVGGGQVQRTVVVAWIVTAVVLGVFIDLPTNNETKFAFPLHLGLVGFAAAGIAAGLKRLRAFTIFAVLAFTIPLHVTYFAIASRDAHTFHLTPEESSVYQWIRSSTPADAVFLEAHDTVRIPVLAQRDLYWGTATYANNWGYARGEMATRRTLRDNVFEEIPLLPDQFDLVVADGRPFYILMRDIHTSNGVLYDLRNQLGFLEGRYVTESFVVFEVNADKVRSALRRTRD